MTHLALVVFALSTLAGCSEASDSTNTKPAADMAVTDASGTNADLGYDAAQDLDMGVEPDATDDATLSDASADLAPSELPGTPVTDYGCVCDGVTDDTACLQQALNDTATWTNRTLEWPIAATCVAANLTWNAPVGGENDPFILRGHGTKLRAPDNHPVRANSPWDPIMRINGGQWLVLDDLDFDGNRDTRTPQENPSHSLLVMSSKDVRIQDLDSIDAVADGLYIAASDGNSLDSRPQRISVINPVIRRSFRNNISIINCVDCEVRGDGNGAESSCQLTDANGTPPQAGIDFEPNASNAVPAILNARLDGCFIARNYGTAVLLHDAGSPRDIVVSNNTMEGDRQTFRATCGAAMHLGSNEVLIENNVFRNFNIDPACRALFDWGAISAPTTTTFQNNEITNIQFQVGTTHLFRVHPANQGGHTIVGNTLTNIGADGGGDWCLDGSPTLSRFEDNTVDGQVQTPNPGCP